MWRSFSAHFDHPQFEGEVTEWSLLMLHLSIWFSYIDISTLLNKKGRGKWKKKGSDMVLNEH